MKPLPVLFQVGAFPNIRRRYGNDFLCDFNFGFKLGDRAYEETSIQNYTKLVKDHYGTINLIDGVTQDRIYKFLYKKFPKHAELSDYLKTEAAKECGTRKTRWKLAL
jgi:hypothetical protein